MLNLLLRRIAAGLVGAAIGAAAAAVATIAAGFAIYAVLQPRLGDAAAAAITAAAFCVIALLVGLLVPLVWRRRPSTRRAREEAETVGTAVEALIGLAGAALGLFRRRRKRTPQAAPAERRSRRRGRRDD